MQTNVQTGDIQIVANEDLSAKEAYLAKLVSNSGAPNMALPDAVTDIALYVIVNGATAGQPGTARPLEPGRNFRAVLKGACVPGDKLCLADPATPADAGKVIKLPEAAGDYVVIAIAEETGAEGQHVKFRPVSREAVTVEA